MPGAPRRIGLLLALGVAAAQATVMPVPAGPDDAVVEVLPQVTRLRPAATPATPDALARPAAPLAAALAREAIETARRTGDARYWGRARAALGAWWDDPRAPADLLVLQATVLQGQHAFDAAAVRLQQALSVDPLNAQAWLTLATLQRLQARYDEALRACAGVARAGAGFHARACALEMRSLRGDDTARDWAALAAAAPDPGSLAWVQSLWGEHLERQGDDRGAAARYQDSLRAAPDLYTALALADLRLRGQQPDAALQALADQPETDAVLLRRAAAWRQRGDARWQTALVALLDRQRGLERRGEDLTPHAREFGLMALWLQDDPRAALRWAERNLTLQKEPIDWWIALESARRTRQIDRLAAWREQLAAAGLRDVRLRVAS